MTTPSPVLFTLAGPYRLAYRRYGNGPATLLAFHGAGQDGRAFAPVGESLRSTFTVYSFDLFYHGQSLAPAGHVVAKPAWVALLAQFLHEQQIGRFSVAGFSLGGRFALATAEAFTSRIDQLWLLAADGIVDTFWFRVATGTAAGRWGFGRVMRYFPLVQRLGHVVARLGLLDRYVLRFAEGMLGTAAQREQVHQSWLAMRELRFNVVELAGRLNQHNVRVRFFAGQFDRVVTPGMARPLMRRLPQHELTVLKTAHNRLIERVAEHLSTTAP